MNKGMQCSSTTEIYCKWTFVKESPFYFGSKVDELYEKLERTVTWHSEIQFPSDTINLVIDKIIYLCYNLRKYKYRI